MLPRTARRFRSRHSDGEYHALRKLARRLGYHLVRADYYSPIPELEELSPELWSEPAPMPGVDWSVDRQLELLRGELREFMQELSAPTYRSGEVGYIPNTYFPALDAHVLHAMLRWQKPRQVVELGSGFSSLLIARAADLNSQAGAPLCHRVVDPYPSPLLEPIAGRIELQRMSAAELQPTLDAGDVLFIDTTHTLKPGGDVQHLLLEVLPSLPQGALVHFHDFFRPFEYPRVLAAHFGVYWQEHYAVQAFLTFNTAFEVLCANYALSRLRREAVLELVPSLEPGMAPSSLWLRRR